MSKADTLTALMGLPDDTPCELVVGRGPYRLGDLKARANADATVPPGGEAETNVCPALEVAPATSPRLYTFRATVWGVVEDVTYLRDPAGRVYLSVPWDGETVGEERTVTVEVRP